MAIDAQMHMVKWILLCSSHAIRLLGMYILYVCLAHQPVPMSKSVSQRQHCLLYFDKPCCVFLSLFFCSFSIPNELLDPANATLFTKSQLITYQLEARFGLNGSVIFSMKMRRGLDCRLCHGCYVTTSKLKTNKTNLSAYCLNEIEFESQAIWMLEFIFAWAHTFCWFFISHKIVCCFS